MQTNNLLGQLQAPTPVGSGVLLGCTICGVQKPASEFYGNGRNICRPCNRAKAKRWAAANPEKRKAIGLKYRNTDGGRTTRKKTRKIWRKQNTASEVEREARYIARIPDAYCRRLCRQRGIVNPTPEQIYRQRIRILAIRSRRTIAILNYGS